MVECLPDGNCRAKRMSHQPNLVMIFAQGLDLTLDRPGPRGRGDIFPRLQSVAEPRQAHGAAEIPPGSKASHHRLPDRGVVSKTMDHQEGSATSTNFQRLAAAPYAISPPRLLRLPSAAALANNFGISPAPGQENEKTARGEKIKKAENYFSILKIE